MRWGMRFGIDGSHDKGSFELVYAFWNSVLEGKDFFMAGGGWMGLSPEVEIGPLLPQSDGVV